MELFLKMILELLDIYIKWFYNSFLVILFKIDWYILKIFFSIIGNMR